MIMHITTLLGVIEALPELRTLLLNVKDNYVDDQLAFALLGEEGTWSATQEGLYRLLHLDPNNEIKFNPGDDIVYPSILRDGDRPGYMVLFLSPVEVVISSFDNDQGRYYTLPIDQALELIDERVTGGFLDNPGSSYDNVRIYRLYNAVTYSNTVMESITSAYTDLIRLTNSQSIEYIRGYIDDNVTDPSMIDSLKRTGDSELRSTIISLTIDRFNKMKVKINEMI